MIGINFVCEEKGFLQSLSLDIELSSTNIAIESFDFDNNSFDDLADYIDFMNFDEYVFFGLENPQRLIRVVNYLQTLVETPVKFITKKSAAKYLNKQELDLIFKKINTLSKLNVNEVFSQGYHCFQTNLYPLSLRKGLLKHLKVDNLSLFLQENKGLLRYFGINSAIYTDQDQKENLPIIYLNSNKLEAKFSEYQFQEPQKTLLENINNFIHTGKVKEIEVPLNYGTLVGINKFHSLYFHNRKFYLDNEYRFNVGISGDSYQNIFNNASLITIPIKLPLVLKQLYPILININKTYKDAKFITAYNNATLPACETSSYYWIGFESNSKKMVFNLPTQRFFEVNTLYLKLFEQIIKNKSTPSSEAKQVLKTLRL